MTINTLHLPVSNLRDVSHFSWVIVPLFVIVLYFYAAEIERRNWSRILAALAFWGMDWFNEICNGLVLHFSNYAPMWSTAHSTSLIILAGLNVEITLMFAVTGLGATMLLPLNKHEKWLGINNRLIIAALISTLCVAIEIVLNKFGMIIWAWAWWNAKNPISIFLLGYLPFFLVCYWVYDMPRRQMQIAATMTILGIDAVLLILLIPLGWI